VQPGDGELAVTHRAIADDFSLDLLHLVDLTLRCGLQCCGQ
jgi:hypothetical protein